MIFTRENGYERALRCYVNEKPCNFIWLDNILQVAVRRAVPLCRVRWQSVQRNESSSYVTLRTIPDIHSMHFSVITKAKSKR